MYMLAFLVAMNRTHKVRKSFATHHHLGHYLQYNRPMIYSLRRFLAQHTMRVRWIAGGLILAAIILLLITPGWAYQWEWTGFGRETDLPSRIHIGIDQPAKTLWDWLQLLVIPAGLAVAGIWFTRRDQNRRDEMNEAALASYISEMSHLVTDRRNDQDQERPGFSRRFTTLSRLMRWRRPRRALSPANATQIVARAQTITAIRRLDRQRNRLLIQFLRESELLRKDKYVISLGLADLQGADLTGADLSYVDLRGANLSKAILTEATLWYTGLNATDLRGARLDGAKLMGADLAYADLSGASGVTADQLRQALSREGMRLPSGQIFKS